MKNEEQYYSVKELIGLPGMPSTDRAIQKRANSQQWPGRQRAGRGGAFEYPESCLPEETQRYLRIQSVNAVMNETDDDEAMRSVIEFANGERQKEEDKQRAIQKAKEEGASKFAALSAEKQQRAKARLNILKGAWEYLRRHRMKKQASFKAFVVAFNAGEIGVPDWVEPFIPKYEGRRGITFATLERWDCAYAKGGIFALADGYGKRAGQNKIEGNIELKKVVISLLLQHPHITGGKIKAYLEAKGPELNIVGVRSIERYLVWWKEINYQIWIYITDHDRWKNISMSAFGSQHERIEGLNHVWEMDSTPGDWLLKDGRHSVIGVIDLYSRRVMYFVSKTSTADAVCQLFRRAVLAWGMPRVVTTDNGADYVSERFNLVLHDLEIEHEICIPFASEQKGTVERMFRTMSHGILDLLPGFIGHNVADRKVIEARKSFAERVMKRDETVEVDMTSDELQAKLDQWGDDIYANNAHRGLKGKTPFQMVCDWTEKPRVITNERALDMLLADIAGTRTMGKKGITFNYHHYAADAVYSHMHEDRKVLLKYDEHDLGRLYVYWRSQFLCVATCPELSGISRQDAAQAYKRNQKSFLQGKSSELKEIAKDSKINVAGDVLQHKAEESAKVSMLPKQTEEYTTPGLQEAAKAAAAADEDAVIAAIAEPSAVESIEPKDPIERHRYMCRLGERIKQGKHYTKHEQTIWENYQRSSDCNTMVEFFEDFGLNPLEAAAE